MVRWVLGILVVAGSLVSGAVAHADPAPLPAAASGGWQSLIGHRFGSDKAPTVGRCGSAPRTPVCAVERYLTCAVQGNAEPCRELAPDSQFLSEMPVVWNGAFFDEYRVTASQAVRPGDQRGAPAASAVRAGADWTVTTEQRFCDHWPPKQCLGDESIRRVWSLARRGAGWVVLGDPVVTAPAALREALSVVRPAEQAPPGWRVLGSDARSSTSRCIGDPRTPLCAIETFMACKHWAATDQCEKIWVRGIAPYDMLGMTVERGERSVSLGYIVQYRVVEVRKMPRTYDGSSLLVTTQERLCDPGTSDCETDLPRLWDWKLGQEHGRWVVTWPGILVLGWKSPHPEPAERAEPDNSLEADPASRPAGARLEAARHRPREQHQPVPRRSAHAALRGGDPPGLLALG